MSVIALDRVTVRPHTLPTDVAVRLASRAAWLRAQLPRLDRGMAVSCPPIEIVPACWRHRLGRQWFLTAGRIYVRERDDALIVQLPASMVLECDEEYVLGVVAHEFLHVVEGTLRAAQVQRSVDGLAPLPPTDAARDDEYTRSSADYRRIDDAHLADPAVWLSADLQRAFARSVNGAPDDANQRVHRDWIGRGLPLEWIVGGEPLPTPMVFLRLDPAIVDHHEALLVARRRVG